MQYRTSWFIYSIGPRGLYIGPPGLYIGPPGLYIEPRGLYKGPRGIYIEPHGLYIGPRSLYKVVYCWNTSTKKILIFLKIFFNIL